MKFKLSANILIQILALVAQLLNALSPQVPDNKKPYLAMVLMFVQGVSAILGHFRNPDGTPAEIPYQPKVIVEEPAIVADPDATPKQ